MTKRFRVITAVCGFLFVSPLTAAEVSPPPDMVDLPAVLKLVRDASPRLAEVREGVTAAQADRITASAYPNPTVGYGRVVQGGGLSGTQFSGLREEQITIEQPLLLPWQYSARIGKADREIDSARARVATGTSTLSAEAGSAYVALLAAQDRSNLLSAAHAELLRLRDIVAGRQASGLASQYDLARIDVELASFDAQIAEASARVSEASATLAALLGIRNWKPRAAGVLSDAIVPETISGLPPAELAKASPIVIAAERERAVADASVTLARRERWPNLSISGGRAWTTHPFGATDFFGLSVEVPIFDTRLGPLARAESEARSAAFRYDAAAAETASNLQGLANAIASREAALKRFEADAASRLPALRQMAEDNYRLRGGSILELLDATRSRIELESTRLELVANLEGSKLRFLAISGNLDRSLAPQTARSVTR